MILKHTSSAIKRVNAAPVSGVYRLDNGELSLVKESSNPVDKGDDESLAFILRITNKDQFAYHGSDLAIIFLNCSLTQARGMELNTNATTWLKAVKNAYDIQALTAEENTLMQRFSSPNSTKGNTQNSQSSQYEGNDND